MSGDPQPREFSHPLLWTAGLVVAAGGLAWLFAHWFGVGGQVGRDDGPVPFGHAEAAKPVNHQALADRSQAVIDRGQRLYLSNCANCHGPNGDQNVTGTNPAPRNFRTEQFKADCGGGPYGFYLTLTKGFGQGMPSFATIEAADRYAIVHYVRETWIKGGDRYLENDPPAVAAQIPSPGTGGGEEAQTPPHLVEQPEHLHPLMKMVGADTDRQVAEARTWIQTTAASVDAGERPVLALVAAAGDRRPGWLLALRAAAVAGDPARVVALLVADASGEPALALAPTGIEAAAAALVRTAAPRI